MRTVLAVLLTIFLAIPTISATTKDQKFIEQAKGAVGLLYSQDESGGMRMRCTVTAFEKQSKGYLFLTAAHCVGSDNTEKERSANPFDTAFYITHDEVKQAKKFYEAKPKWVGYQSRGEDFAVFYVETEDEWKVIPLGDEQKETEGAPYFNFASPLGLGVQVQEGIISSLYLDRPIKEGDIMWKGVLVIQQAGVNGGSSGSPLVAKDQQAIVGTLVGSIGGSTIVAIPISRFKAVRTAVEAGKYKWWTSQQDLNPDGTPK